MLESQDTKVSARQALLERRRQILDLRGRHLAELDELLADRAADWVDQSTEEWEAGILSHFSDAELGELKSIDAALRRVEAGTYGTCSHCGDRIDGRRLALLPHATSCVSCANELSRPV